MRDASKKEQFQKGVDKIFDKIDSVYLVKKVMEIEKLKVLLLSPNQLKLFENLPRPKIFNGKPELTREYTSLNS
jgi:hypothetical protein